MRSKIFSIIVLVGLMIPSPLIAAGLPAVALGAKVGRVTVPTTIAGLEAQVDMVGFVANTNLELHIVGPSGDDSALPTRSNAAGAVQVSVPEALTEEAGSYSAYVQTDDGIAARTSFAVLPDRMDTGASAIESDVNAITPDGRTEATVTVTLIDKFGNPLSGRPVELISSRPEDHIEALTQATDDMGQEHFSVRTLKPGNIVLRAMDLLSGTTVGSSFEIDADDGSLPTGGPSAPARSNFLAQATDPGIGTNPPSSNAAGSADSFEITLDPSVPKVNEVLNLKIRALDADGNVAQGYTGTVTLEAKDDPGASLPGFGEGHGTVKFTAKNQGVRRIPLSVSFSQAGRPELLAIDKSDPANLIQGKITVTVSGGREGPTEGKKIEILSHRDGGGVTGTNILLEGIGPVYSGLIASGGMEDAEGDTDVKGRFSIPVSLDPALNRYTLRVRDASRGYDSGPIVLTRDNVPPQVQFVFEPNPAKQDSIVTLTARSEPHLQEVTFLMENQNLRLSESVENPGTYQVMFTAPAQGQYQAKVTGIDGAGNAADVSGPLIVGPRDLPSVQDVKAEPALSGVKLSWTGVDESEAVNSYIVYVGTGATDLSSSLDTGDLRTGVAVMGLKAGQPYYFAVAIKKGNRQGPKSTIVTAVPTGLALNAEGADGSVRLQWKYPDERVSSYVLQYGIEPGKFTEKRTIIGSQEGVFMMKDLLSGVTYYVRITPVSLTGELLTEVAAQTQVTVSAAKPGFHAGPEDPVKNVPKPGEALPDIVHKGAPSTPDSGISSMILFALAAASTAAFVIGWHRKRTALKTHEFLRAMETRYRR